MALPKEGSVYKFSRRWLLLATGMVVAACTGYASAQDSAESTVLPASACPEAASAYAAAGMTVDTFGPTCPSGDQVALDIKQAKDAASFMEAAEAGTLKPKVKVIPAKACPAATAAFEAAGMPVDGYGGYCPEMPTVRSLVEEQSGSVEVTP